MRFSISRTRLAFFENASVQKQRALTRSGTEDDASPRSAPVILVSGGVALSLELSPNVFMTACMVDVIVVLFALGGWGGLDPNSVTHDKYDTDLRGLFFLWDSWRARLRSTTSHAQILPAFTKLSLDFGHNSSGKQHFGNLVASYQSYSRFPAVFRSSPVLSSAATQPRANTRETR